MFNGLTTVSQGSVGLGIAIGYFCSKGCVVSVPLNDNQSYDLVVDYGEGLKKVQVKTTRRKSPYKNNHYVVALKRMHHNRTENVMRPFDTTAVDFLFVVTEENTKYLIPCAEMTCTSDITLNESYQKYIVEGESLGVATSS